MKYVAGAVAGFILASSLSGLWLAYSEPYCPTEDSCTIDYRDGRWHVKEDQP